MQRTRETYLGNQSDECTEICTQQSNGGEHLESDKKPLVFEKKRRVNEHNVQQEFKRNTRESGNESVLTSSTNYQETAQHDVVPNYKTAELFLKEQLKNTVDEVVLTAVGTLRTRTRRSLKTLKPRRVRGENAVTSAGKTKLRMRTRRRQRQSCANPLNSAKHSFVL